MKKLNKTELVAALEEMGVEASMKQTRQQLADLYDAACEKLAGQFHDSDVPDHAPEMLFIYTKDTKGTVSRDLLDYSTVTVDEIAEAGHVMHCLAANFMAGTVDPDIEDAAEKRGGIKRLFNKTTVSDANINAIKWLVSQKPEMLRECWNDYAKDAKRVRPVTLQRLAKESKPSGAGESKKSVKDRFLEAWATVPAEKQTDPDLIALFDLAQDLTPEA
jgi:hypothetical protein